MKANFEAVAPRLNYRHRRLTNGLNVYALRDKSSANVAVHVWYQVGSKDDPAGRSGFAHLFEHLMFKATRNMPAEFIDRLTEDVGGYNNASTYDDFTNYYETVPANHLERVLWAEAERMGSLIIDDAAFNAERDVVIEELRERVFAEPYGRLFYYYLAQANYDAHPYGRPGIGSIEDLKAATLEDVRAFHAAFYRPDNALLVISGDFDDAQLDEWVDLYFARIPANKTDIPLNHVIEPPRNRMKRLTVSAPNAPLSAVTISWPGLSALDKDIAALHVLDAILSRGESSRLYQSAVYEAQLATEVFTIFEATRDPSVFTIGAIIAEGRTVAEGESALLAIIAGIVADGVTEAEVSEARNEILTEKLELRETADGRAFELADAVSRYGDANMADALLGAIAKVTVDDVSRLARRLFAPRIETIIQYQHEDSPAAAKDTIDTSPSVVALPLNHAEDRSTEAEPRKNTHSEVPAPQPTRTISAPAHFERNLENGLRVIVAPKRGVPLVSAALKFRSAQENLDPVATDFMTSLAMKGTKARSAREIAQEIEASGASVSTSAMAEASAVTALMRTDSCRAVLNIFADIVMNPLFEQGEHQRLLSRRIDDLTIQMSDPASIASRVLTRSLFDDRYGAVATPRSLGSLTQEEIIKAHTENWTPKRASFTLCGDIDPEAGFALAAEMFRTWRAPRSEKRGDGEVKSTAPRCVIIDMPEAAQAAVCIGLQGPARSASAYMPTLLATGILGGGYSARLNTEIRVKRGLSYGAGARLTAFRSGGKIVASTQTRNDAAALVVDLIFEALQDLRTKNVSSDELVARKAAVIGGFGRNIETTSGLAAALSDIAFFELPPDTIRRFVSDIEDLNAESVRRAAMRYFDPQNATIVIVGDASQFEKEILAHSPHAEVLPLPEIDLNSASLR